MLVDEIEVPEAVHIAQGGVVAHCVSLVGIGEAAKNVPRRGDGEKQQEPSYGLERAPTAPLARKQQIGDSGAGEKHGRNQALDQQCQRHTDPHAIETRGADGLKAGEQAVERDEKKQRQLRLGNNEAGKQKRPNGSEHAESGIEAGACSPGASAPRPCKPGQPQHGK